MTQQHCVSVWQLVLDLYPFSWTISHLDYFFQDQFSSDNCTGKRSCDYVYTVLVCGLCVFGAPHIFMDLSHNTPCSTHYYHILSCYAAVGIGSWMFHETLLYEMQVSSPIACILTGATGTSETYNYIRMCVYIARMLILACVLQPVGHELLEHL